MSCLFRAINYLIFDNYNISKHHRAIIFIFVHKFPFLYKICQIKIIFLIFSCVDDLMKINLQSILTRLFALWVEFDLYGYMYGMKSAIIKPDRYLQNIDISKVCWLFEEQIYPLPHCQQFGPHVHKNGIPSETTQMIRADI